MASPRENQTNRDLAAALAAAFDAVGPANRAEAEEELRATGIDPEALAQRIEHLAHDMLNGSGEVPSTARASRRWSLTARWPWAAAAAVVLCVMGWALTRGGGSTPS